MQNKPALTLTKEITFDMAHRLAFYEGKCRNIHGHTYKLQITVVEDPSKEFIDFAKLSADLKRVAERFDHKVFLDGRDTVNVELAKVMRAAGLDFVLTTYEPTAENMLADIIQDFSEKYKVASARLWETPTSYAEVTL